MVTTPAPAPAVKIEPAASAKKETAPTLTVVEKAPKKEEPVKVNNECVRFNNHKDDSDEEKIIPWRAQLRKTNSKLNILD